MSKKLNNYQFPSCFFSVLFYHAFFFEFCISLYIFPVGSITAVNTVDNILTSQKRNCGGTEYCIVYAYITQFNIDGDVSIVIAKWWASEYWQNLTSQLFHFYIVYLILCLNVNVWPLFLVQSASIDWTTWRRHASISTVRSGAGQSQQYLAKFLLRPDPIFF